MLFLAPYISTTVIITGNLSGNSVRINPINNQFAGLIFFKVLLQTVTNEIQYNSVVLM